jgi:uncharacterized repeat protein (TIGR01451 family)
MALAAWLLHGAQTMSAHAHGLGAEAPPLAADLEVDVDALAEFVKPGETLVYTMRYTNTTASPIFAITLVDSLSPGQYFDGSYASSPAIPPANFTRTSPLEMEWSIPFLAANTSGIITISVVVSTTFQPDINDPIILVGNSAEMETTTPNVTTGSDADPATVTGPLLILDKEASVNETYPGRHITYDLTLQNALRADSIAATNIVITDALPEDTTFLSATAGGVYNAGADAVVWNVPGPLPPGNFTLLSFAVEVDPASTASNIKNNKNDYHARAAEMLVEPVAGESTVTVDLLPLLEKVVVGTHKIGNNPASYLGETATYTLTVHNPFNVTLTNVIVTDTLPGEPDPFEYLQPAGGSPPPNTISPDGRQLTWIVTLPPWGSVTRSFVVEVPPHTAIDPNKSSQDYPNTLNASHASLTFPQQDNLADLKVEAVLVMDKTVNPTHGLPGSLVTYTIELENVSPYPVNNITLTDTMEGPLFSYHSMVAGPQPVPGWDDNPVVWTGINVPAHTTVIISFRAVIDGVWLDTYKNDLLATSPDFTIPARTNLAAVKIDSGLALDKTVTPSTAFRGDNVVYDFTISNPTTETLVITKIEDFFESGFTQVGGGNPGGNPARLLFNPSLSINPGGTWDGSMTVNIGNSIACSTLPKTYKNDPGDVVVHFTAPFIGTAANINSLAPLEVIPHIETDLTAYRTAVLPGGTVTYTLELKNVSSSFANDQDISLLIPAEFTYQSTVSGPAPSSVAANLLSWNDLDIPGNSTVTIIFRVSVSPTATLGNKDAIFSFVDQPPICFEKLDNGEGRVEVVDSIIEMEKTPNNVQVPSGGIVEYTVKFTNRDSNPFNPVTITDTLPAGFSFVGMLSGPAPSVISGTQVIWQGYSLGGGMTTWKFQVQAAILFGNYYNHIAAYTPETPIEDELSDPVTVLPQIDLTLDVMPATIPAGQTVFYTITLINISGDSYGQISITDTLPAGFSFGGAMPGYPAPNEINLGGRQVVWRNLSVPSACEGGCEVLLVFKVIVNFSVPPGVYGSDIDGYSPEVLVPDIVQGAPVTVTSSGLVPVLWLPIVARE